MDDESGQEKEINVKEQGEIDVEEKGRMTIKQKDESTNDDESERLLVGLWQTQDKYNE